MIHFLAMCMLLFCNNLLTEFTVLALAAPILGFRPERECLCRCRRDGSRGETGKPASHQPSPAALLHSPSSLPEPGGCGCDQHCHFCYCWYCHLVFFVTGLRPAPAPRQVLRIHVARCPLGRCTPPRPLWCLLCSHTLLYRPIRLHSQSMSSKIK